VEDCYYNQLPLVGQELVDQIEGYSGKTIGVIQRSSGPACRISHQIADLAFPDLGAIPSAAAVHELLHIRRNWPEKIPQLFAAAGLSDPRLNVIAGLDNDLEHLVISPEQKALGFDPALHWNTRLGEKWRGNFWEKARCPEDRRLSLLQGALTAGFLATDRSLESLVESVIKKENLLAEAQRYCADMRTVLGSKEKMAACLVNHLKISPAWVKLVLFDVKNDAEISSDVPTWP
jgi:hypothetical protein